MKTVFADPAVKLQFAGHETFPLRLLWLAKAYDACATEPAQRGTFQEQDSIARFGVGRNMAVSMRHWALAAGVIHDTVEGLAPTSFGRLLFDLEHGVDPYLEDPTSLWLVHLALAGTPEQTTTIFYAFNGLGVQTFDRELVVSALADQLSVRPSQRVSRDTLKRDIEVFVRNYLQKDDAAEDASEPLLAELGLVQELRPSGQFGFVRGPKPTLNDAVFALALAQWRARWSSASPTLSVEQATYAPGSPGRVFKLDEDSVLERLVRIENATDGALVWTDTAGLRQVQVVRPPKPEHLLKMAFAGRRRWREAA